MIKPGNYLKNKLRPLSQPMTELLMDCHERELLKLEPCEAGSVKYAAKGLIERGLLETNFHTIQNGKKIMALFVTEAGKQYLKNL